MSKLQRYASEIRSLSLQMIHVAGSGHPGGCLSVADILACLYFSELRVDPQRPQWSDRDRFVLSKGHSCPALYAALAMRGFFPREELFRLRKTGALLQGHPDVGIPGIDTPSGSLGMGLSVGVGMALAAKYTEKNFRVYVVLGDGDMEEGNTWEAIMAAGHHKLDNLVAILDFNKLQGEAHIENIMDYRPVLDKIRPFHWHIVEINGNDVGQVFQALQEARVTTGRPTFIVANTIKGKGVDFMEGIPKWQGSLAPSDEELKSALGQIQREVTAGGR
jgi:transketolase